MKFLITFVAVYDAEGEGREWPRKVVLPRFRKKEAKDRENRFPSRGRSSVVEANVYVNFYFETCLNKDRTLKGCKHRVKNISTRRTDYFILLIVSSFQYVTSCMGSYFFPSSSNKTTRVTSSFSSS